MNDITDKLIKVSEAARRIQRTRSRVYQLIDEGIIPTIEIGGVIFINVDDLAAAEERNKQVGRPPQQSMDNA